MNATQRNARHARQRTQGNAGKANKQASNVFSPTSSNYNRSSKDAVGTTGLSFGASYFVQGGFAAALTGAADGANYIQGDAEL